MLRLFDSVPRVLDSTGEISLSNISSLVIFALTFRPGQDLLGSQVSHSLQDTAFTQLTPDSLVDAILNGVDVLVAGDLGLTQFV